VLDSIEPTVATAWTPSLALTVHGSDFVRASRVQVNGVSRPTTYVSDTTLTATVPASDLATPAAGLSITVFSPGPGGGTSAARTLALTQPSLAVDRTTAPAGEAITVTLTNGPGGTRDWLALAEVGRPDASGQYVQWTYVGSEATQTWTVNAPATGGQYEFRFFANDTFTRAATSPAVSVTAAPPPALAVSGTTVPGGTPVTVTLTNGLGGPRDWLALAEVGRPDASGQYVQWIYVGAGVTATTWIVNAPTTPGQYEFRLFPNDTYTRLATSPAFTVPVPPPSSSPELTVNPTTAPGGTPVTVTLTNGLGGARDWLALAAVGRPDGSGQYVQWIYVGAGVATTTWTVNAPTISGPYEFRLFANDTYTRLATSPAFTVPTPPPSSSPELTVSATTVPGGTPVTVTLTNGLGGARDWLALAAVDRPDGPSQYVQWVYVGAGITTLPWTVTAPTAPGQYEFRLFANDTYTRLATSPAFTVPTPPPPSNPPEFTLSATTVAGGTPVTVTLTNGLGGARDWLALAAVDRPDGPSQYVQWIYVGAGVTTLPWTVTAPTAPGQYEFRLFANDTYTRLATSPAFTVPGPALTVDTTTATPGGPVTVTLTHGLGGPRDWLALAAVGAPATSYLQWVYVGAGVTTQTWTVAMPAAAGQYEFRLFLNDGFGLAGTSPPVTVAP
jgi:hypothetical protein